MKSLKIFLAPFAYYVRLDKDDFEENLTKGNFQKWVDNRKGRLCYEFIEFESLNESSGLEFPKKVTKIGLCTSRVLCYHPFEFKMGDSLFEPEKIISEFQDELHMIFREGQSGKLRPNDKYYTKEGEPYISQISFYIDESSCNLQEKVEFSNGLKKSYYYHVIARGKTLQKPEFYALFEFR